MTQPRIRILEAVTAAVTIAMFAVVLYVVFIFRP